MTSRKLKQIEAEYLEAGEEPAHVIATGRLGRGEVQELRVFYIGSSVTVVEGWGIVCRNTLVFDEILEPSEVLAEFEPRRRAK